MKFNELNNEEKEIILNKGTEKPFSGKFNNHKEKGLYLCKRCNNPLYYSKHKFISNCGWPSFDDEIEYAIEKRTDDDGIRTEILCYRCNAHLGHIFEGEGLTDKNKRHCVNSISLNFIADKDLEKAIYAGGCFWGVEYFFQRLDGVIMTTVGYTGGSIQNPKYEEVCQGKTGHIEAIEVLFNKNLISYEELTKYFFEIHNPTQENGQGPDIGEQYISAIFYNDHNQKEIATKIINYLKGKGLDVVTKLIEKKDFYKAEEYHQKYYEKRTTVPYCHNYTKRFD